jgi:hypothetical protein
MIDWYNLASNILWIFGSALALAVLSYASWNASVTGQKLRTILGKSSYQVALHAAGLLFSLGLAATTGRGWEMWLWLALALGFIVQLIWLWIDGKKKQLTGNKA